MAGEDTGKRGKHNYLANGYMYENGSPPRDSEHDFKSALLKRDELLRSIAFCQERIRYYSSLERKEKVVHAWQETLAQEEDRLKDLYAAYHDLSDDK